MLKCLEGDLDIQGQEGRLGSKIFAVLGLGPAVTGIMMLNLKLRLGRFALILLQYSVDVVRSFHKAHPLQ